VTEEVKGPWVIREKKESPAYREKEVLKENLMKIG